jgi:hypothetical protein
MVVNTTVIHGFGLSLHEQRLSVQMSDAEDGKRLTASALVSKLHMRPCRATTWDCPETGAAALRCAMTWRGRQQGWPVEVEPCLNGFGKDDRLERAHLRLATGKARGSRAMLDGLNTPP